MVQWTYEELLLLSNAVARANAECLKCIQMVVFLFVGLQEALRPELPRLGPIIWTMICGPLLDLDEGLEGKPRLVT